MNVQPLFLWTDILIYVLVLAVIIFAIYTSRHEYLRAPWRQVAKRKIAMIAAVILSFYVMVGLLDSIHLQNNQTGKVFTVLDILVSPIGDRSEKSYSAPFATHEYTHSANPAPLKYSSGNVLLLSLLGVLKGLLAWLVITALVILFINKHSKQTVSQTARNVLHGKTEYAWREIIVTTGLLCLIIAWCTQLDAHYHIFGTDKVGNDVFYESIKSIRTGLVIGTLTTLVMLPFAVSLGIMAGYFGGFIDDVIQYIYTTIASVPSVLLIMAAILALQIYIANHTQYFPTLTDRADARLLALCVVLGITSWTGLCRVIRGETLKVRELDYVHAATVLGVSKPKIMLRHILPNVMHIVLITVVLDFSTLVLAEAILSYVGIGVDPTMISWGNMINSARLELAREPIVWWPIIAAFIFMFTLVLSANLFADAIRDAFDPRTVQQHE